MYIGVNDEVSGLDYSLVKLTSEEFDNKMCTEFPEIFQDRRKPMQVTCMCWGFSVGPGWFPLLYKLCSMLYAIYKLTGIVTIADQVKEKYGGLRFYNHINGESLKIDKSNIDIWCDMIEKLCQTAESDSYHICAHCGKYMRHKQIVIGQWVYDVCKSCFEKVHPDRIDDVNELFKWRKEDKQISQYADKIIEEKKCSHEEFLQGLKVLFGVEPPPFDNEDDEE